MKRSQIVKKAFHDFFALNNDKTFEYQGFRIPVKLVDLTGGGTETFDQISQGHRLILKKHLKIEKKDSVLEIGSGIGRDVFHLIVDFPDLFSYLGVEIIRESVDWCNSSISTKYPNYRFSFFDISDQLHNPKGKLNMSEMVLPIQNEEISKVFLWSVFTHMDSDGISRYFSEFARVMKPEAIGYASCFIVNEEILTSALKNDLTPYDLKFQHPYGQGCWINNLDFPMGAVAYDEARIDSLLLRNNLERVGPFHKGFWSGYWKEPEDGQDGFCFRKISK